MQNKETITDYDPCSAEWQKDQRIIRKGKQTEEMGIYQKVRKAYMSVSDYDYVLSRDGEFARLFRDIAKALNGLLSKRDRISHKDINKISSWAAYNNKIGMDQWDRMTDLIMKRRAKA